MATVVRCPIRPLVLAHPAGHDSGTGEALACHTGVMTAGGDHPHSG